MSPGAYFRNFKVFTNIYSNKIQIEIDLKFNKTHYPCHEGLVSRQTTVQIEKRITHHCKKSLTYLPHLKWVMEEVRMI